MDGRTYRCGQGHAFDRAREGYVDLLPVGHGRSGITGDTRAMARARQRFLRAGHYRRLVDRVKERVAEHAGRRRGGQADADAGPITVAESGCGVGHYIGAVARHLGDGRAFGFDVSRDALRVAARAHPDVTFAINDVTHRLCLPDGVVDVLLDVFAPRNAAEFRRVLRPEGLLLVVIPAPDHLSELRARLPLLDIDRDKRERTLDQLATELEPAWEEELRWTAALPPADAADLVRMTPSAFHLEEEELTGRSPGEDVTLSFLLMGLHPR